MVTERKIDQTHEITSLLVDLQPQEPQALPAVAVAAKLLPTPVAEAATDDEELRNDFALARQTLRGLLEKSETALEGIIEISKDSEHPRAFEVAGQLINTISGVAKDLVGLQKQKREITQPTQGPTTVETNNTIEQAVFVGSTADLQNMIQQKNNDAITIEPNSEET